MKWKIIQRQEVRKRSALEKRNLLRTPGNTGGNALFALICGTGIKLF